MDDKAIINMQTAITDNIGDISEFPVELQNTVANIYYNAAIIAQNSAKFAMKNGGDALDRRIADAAFYVESVKALPDVICSYRDVISKGNNQEIEYLTEVLLFMFKYRIRIGSKPYFIAKIQRFFRRGKVDEIPDLYKKITNYSDDYKTFEQWYYVYKQAAGKANPQLETDKDGQCVLDFLEHEPLERAYKDGVDPESLAILYANQFDISTLELKE